MKAWKNVKAIVMDKTGTITKGNFVVQKANPAGNAMTANDLLAISASCELSSTHPIGNSIVEAAEEKGTFYRKTIESRRNCRTWYSCRT